MSRELAAILNLLGTLMTLSGLVLQRRALARYGKRPHPRGSFWGVGPGRAVWNCTDLFADPRGIRRFLQGDALMSWGMILVFAMIGYMAGMRR